MKLLKISLIVLAFTIVSNVLISPINENIKTKILSNFKDKPRKELFKVYHFLFNKSYDLNSEEGLKRYRIFKENMKSIEKLNSLNKGFTLGITSFTDLTREEFKSLHLKGIKKELYNQKSSFLSHKSYKEYLPGQLKINWAQNMNPSKNQGMCGSCWAFSTINSIEGNYNIKFGKSLEFSQQQLVDCDLTNFGCDGGYPDEAMNYIKTKGIAYYNAYSYISGESGKRGTCDESSVQANFVVENFEYCPYSVCEKNQLMGMLQKGPVVVLIDGDGRTEATSIFQHYTGGVLEMPCKEINHAVNMIGIDSDSTSDYYIGSNSWGTDWGENGNFRIRVRESDKTCFMEEYGVLPIVKETTNPIPDPIPDVPSCLKLFTGSFNSGESIEICENTPIVNFPIVASSDIGKFKEVKMFMDKNNCMGSYYLINSSLNSFELLGYSYIVNNIKSVIVDDTLPPQGCIWVYDENCLSGNKLELCGNVTDLKNNNFSNKISSFKLGPGVISITVYMNPNYSGSYATTKYDRYGMAGVWWDNNIESIKITK